MTESTNRPKFTPGPYRLIKEEKWPFGYRIEANGITLLTQAAVASSTQQATRADNEAGVGYTGKPGSGWSAKEAMAAIEAQDAMGMLWAAAPALYEALELAMGALHEAKAILGGEYGDHYQVLCDKMAELESKADMALKQARGEHD